MSNRSNREAALDLLPTLWFRNTWSWGLNSQRPSLSIPPTAKTFTEILAEHETLGRYQLACEGEPELLFTENDTNNVRLFGAKSESLYVKDAFHDYIVRGDATAVNPTRTGTKAAARYRLSIPPGESRVVRLRLSTNVDDSETFGG